MLLKISPSSSLLCSRGDNFSPLFPSVSLSSSPISILRFSQARNGGGFSVSATSREDNQSLFGVVFEPFEEVKKELDLVPTMPQDSLARQKFSEGCEAAINGQIKLVLFLLLNPIWLCHLCEKMSSFMFRLFFLFPFQL